MEDSETHLFQTRKGHRIEQMVVRWLRRSRDNSSCGRVSTGESPPGGPNQFGCSLTLTLVIEKDLLLHNYGFDISRKPPLTVIAVTAGSPAEGKLLAGDQILRINNEDVENISVEKAANMVRESGDSIKMTVLRNTSSPKSSFLTAEKRARLRSNPVKVRFAEEVIVNGHTQGNSLLFMPNVLKVYLENGQTKAFKFEKKTTVKDIIMTLKEKLSINIIEHFALALEEQYNIAKLFLLHEDELIEQVVQKRESHDYRCLLRVCFVPRDPLSLLQEDPVAFEYLYLQSCSDVLQERFAVEMKCSVALRLAALHIQERIHSCGQSQKISFKYIEKDWGIDNFLSPTLLRNMRGKDIKKAISFHIKRNQNILEPRQKQPISATQLRIQYLKLLGDLKTYGGKIFNATLMLQDRESYVTLLVGAKYGISQIINNKLNIMTTLAEFASISKIELNPESEKVSLVKVYLQDIKPISLLLESNNAKDIACLISGYCKLFVDPGANIFTWPRNSQVHRVSTEEGYESRACSDSEESSDVDSSLELLSERHFLKYKEIKPLQEEEEEDTEEEGIQELKQDNEKKVCDDSERKGCDGGNNDTDSISDASDSANTESQGYKVSWSSDSIDALEEDDLETCSSSRPEFFQFYSPVLKNMGMDEQVVFSENQELKDKRDGGLESDPLLCFLQLPNGRVDAALDTKEMTTSHRDMEGKEENESLCISVGCHFVESNIMEYYSLCTNVSPASSIDKNVPSSPESNCVKELLAGARGMGLSEKVETLILDPPPGFGDSSSEDEFFDAADRFTPTLTSPGRKASSNRGENIFYYPDIAESYDSNISMEKNIKPKNSRRPTKLSRKRRSFLQTDYTAQVTYPLSPSSSSEAMDHVCCYEKESHMSSGSHSQTVSSLKDIEGEPALLEMKPLIKHKSILKTKRKTHSPTLMEMEPDTMEIKSVTDTVASSISAIRFRSDSGAEEKEQIGIVFQDGPNNGEHTPHWSTVEHSGRASPSQISLQMENISEHSDFCQELICDINSINLFKEANILDDIEPEIKATFTNIFENVSHSTDTSTYLGSNCSSDLTGRKSLYVAEESIPFMKSTIKNDSPQCDGNIEILTSSKNDNPNQSPSNNSKSNKLFDFSHATDLLFDFKGITDMLTSLPINSFKVGSTSTVSNGQNSPPCEEKEHLLKYTSESDVEDLDVVDMKRNRFLSSSPSSSKAAQVTFELSSDENGDEKEHSELLLSSNTHTIKQNIYESSHKDYSNNLDEHSLKNGSCSLHNLEPKSPEIPKVGNLGNCSCQLSYTSCFRGVNVDVDDEIVDSEATISSLPRTLPPVSGNTLFTEKNHFAITNGTSSTMVGETLHLLRVRIGNSPSGYSMLQDSVLDLQKIIQDFKKESRVHPLDKCAKVFSEQKSCLCNVSRKMMTTSQKILRSDQSSDEMYQVAEETFFDLMEMTEVCLQFSSCAQCFKRHLDVHTNLRDLICTYNQFIQAIKKASDNENRDLYFKLLSRQCTALTAAAFCLTQHYRTVLSL
ncbi:FERM and PDZ domain-containing 1 isoform X1 [Pelobates cultripes]|uniref:FERM and PDZ domain-containing 1 isoform X1 n=2 Tax=Pelobates cultripes TaxID=61616 RepID=A0AAD1S8I5_PELCU|nr:FERM and PDZ domain-containing 1 isoform X1 [Pelobates cultripes]